MKVIEAEYEPAVEVEMDASDRLGLRMRGASRTVEAAIALRYPKTVEDAYDLRSALVETRLTYCVLHQDGSRFPESGWLGGSVSDLVDIARLVSVPQKAVEQAADTLEQGIRQAGVAFSQAIPNPPLQDHIPVLIVLGVGRVRRNVRAVRYLPTEGAKPV